MKLNKSSKKFIDKTEIKVSKDPNKIANLQKSHRKIKDVNIKTKIIENKLLNQNININLQMTQFNPRNQK